MSQLTTAQWRKEIEAHYPNTSLTFKVIDGDYIARTELMGRYASYGYGVRIISTTAQTTALRDHDAFMRSLHDMLPGKSFAQYLRFMTLGADKNEQEIQKEKVAMGTQGEQTIIAKELRAAEEHKLKEAKSTLEAARFIEGGYTVYPNADGSFIVEQQHGTDASRLWSRRGLTNWKDLISFLSRAHQRLAEGNLHEDTANAPAVKGDW